jgi:hypothetical protein
MATTRRNKKIAAAPPMPCSVKVGPGLYETPSWSDPGTVYRQDLAARTCTCPAGEKELWCRHLTAAFWQSMANALTTGRDADPRDMRKLLKLKARQDRPELEVAMVIQLHAHLQAEWNEKQTPVEPPPAAAGPRPGSWQEHSSLTAEQYASGVALLSEGRKVAA